MRKIFLNAKKKIFFYFIIANVTSVFHTNIFFLSPLYEFMAMNNVRIYTDILILFLSKRDKKCK